MPINKDALKRFRIIDKRLSDPYFHYTTEDILKAVKQEGCDVSLRMIQKDILAIEEEFGKEIIRNEGWRGTVRYKDQSEPIFYKKLTEDEQMVLREVMSSLGQFDGLDNFPSLDLLKRKFQLESRPRQVPIISFSKNEGLQIPGSLLGQLFTAISRKKVIRFRYTAFGGETREYTVYPYQLKQYNDRWFLLSTPLADKNFAYDPEFVATFPLDRICGQFDIIDSELYLEAPVDLTSESCTFLYN